MLDSPRLQITTLALAVAIGVAGCSKSSQPISPSGVTSAGSLRASGPPPPGFVDPNPGQPNVEWFEVCKAYSGTPGPSPVNFTYTVDIGTNGSIDVTNGAISVPAGECRLVWGADGFGDTVTITEQVPAGYSSSITVLTVATPPVGPQTILGNVATGRVGSGRGVTALYVNTAGPLEGDGRFTGGGNQIKLDDNVRVSRGLTIHCDLLLSNNLEVNWGQGNNFHMTEHLTTVSCTDDPDIIQAPPPAPLDTLIGTGTGKFNGVDGYTVQFTLQDFGEPGTADKMAIRIFETANPSNVVLNIPLNLLANGNLQAHFDQPHK